MSDLKILQILVRLKEKRITGRRFHQTYPYFGRFSPGERHSRDDSHWDAAVFGRHIFRLGERELSLHTGADKTTLSANSFPKLRGIAHFEIFSGNLTTGKFHDEREDHARRCYLQSSWLRSTLSNNQISGSTNPYISGYRIIPS